MSCMKICKVFISNRQTEHAMEVVKAEPILNNNSQDDVVMEEPIVETEVVLTGTIPKPNDPQVVPIKPKPKGTETEIADSITSKIANEPVRKPDEAGVTAVGPNLQPHDTKEVTAGSILVIETEAITVQPKQETLPATETSEKIESATTQVEETMTEEEMLEKLKKKRSEIRYNITKTCDEISSTLQRVGSLTSLNAMVTEAQDLLRQSEELNDQICDFYELVDTSKEFQLQLEYQGIVQDAKEEVQNYSELF